MEPNHNASGNPWATAAVWPAIQDALKLLHVDEHEVGEAEDYEAFLAGNFFGCAACIAAFVLRAASEGKSYQPIRWEQYEPEFVERPLPDFLASPPLAPQLVIYSVNGGPFQAAKPISCTTASGTSCLPPSGQPSLPNASPAPDSGAATGERT